MLVATLLVLAPHQVGAQPTTPPTAPTAASAEAAPPELSLPTPPGEAWAIIQGYGCGTHDTPEDRYAIDLVAADGRTLGAPVRAAAPGVIRAWVEPSGTLILDHGAGFLTQYTHMEPLLTAEGTLVPRGAEVGFVGERGAPGNPHLHFALLVQPQGDPTAARAERRSLPLRFREGVELTEAEGCSQNAGALLTAVGTAQPRIVRTRLVGEARFCPARGLCML